MPAGNWRRNRREIETTANVCLSARSNEERNRKRRREKKRNRKDRETLAKGTKRKKENCTVKDAIAAVTFRNSEGSAIQTNAFENECVCYKNILMFFLPLFTLTS